MSDERIDRVLRELGGAQAADGIERRIARGVEQRLASARGTADERGPSRIGSAGRSWAAAPGGGLRTGWVLGAAMTVAVLAVMLAPGPRRRPPSRAVERRPLVPAETARRSAAGAGSSRAAGGPVRSAPRPATPRGGAGVVRGGPAARAVEAEIADASYAPTRVAPPEPLTRQEQLLLRVVHRGGPEEIAVLDARVRDAKLVADKAQFEEFFKPRELPKQDQ